MKVAALSNQDNLRTLASACAVFSGVVHLGLVGRHYEEAPVTGILFAIAGVGQLVAVFVGYPVHAQNWNLFQLVFNGGLIGLWLVSRFWAVPLIHGSPEPIDALGLETKAEVARAYFLADYTRDYAAAWKFISAGDKAFKTRAQYLSENPATAGLRAELLQQLAAWGNFTVLARVSSEPEQAIVSTRVSYPDRAQPGVTALLLAAGQPGADARALREQLQGPYRAGQIQFVEARVAFSLTQDPDGWRIVLHWDGAITVRLTAAHTPDLPWEFYPTEPEIQVMPGATVQTSYFVRNTSDRAITGKAVHEVLPLEYRSYLETIQCFCFVEQTLGAGEAREMPLIFRIDFTVPQGVKEFTNGYTFYPLESYPLESFPDLTFPTPVP